MPALYRMDRDQFSGSASTRSSRGLAKPTERRRQILSLVALHRVITPQLLRRAYPTLYPYDKKAKRDLDSLAAAGTGDLLKYESEFRFYPDVYVITNRGYQQCLNYGNVPIGIIPRRYEQPKGKQLLHELSITEAAINRYEYVRSVDGVTILREGRFGLLPDDLTDGDDTTIFENIVPDYWYLKDDKRRLMFRCEEHFVGEASGTRIKEKLLEYLAWEQRPEVQRFLVELYRKHGAKQPAPEYEVHCVLANREFHHTDEDKERTTMMQTFYVPAELQGRVWMTTRNAINEAMDTGNFNHRIWHRGKDLLDKRERFARRSGRERTRLLAEWMRSLETYPLFA